MVREESPTVYICSPYAGDVEKNVEAVRKYCRFAYGQDAIPVAPHLFLPQFMNDSDELERLEMGKKFITFCDELWVFYDKYSEINKVMSEEMEFADCWGLVIRHFTTDCTETDKDDELQESKPDRMRRWFVYKCKELDEEVCELGDTVSWCRPWAEIEKSFCAVLKGLGEVSDAYLELREREQKHES